MDYVDKTGFLLAIRVTIIVGMIFFPFAVDLIVGAIDIRFLYWFIIPAEIMGCLIIAVARKAAIDLEDEWRRKPCEDSREKKQYVGRGK